MKNFPDSSTNNSSFNTANQPVVGAAPAPVGQPDMRLQERIIGKFKVQVIREKCIGAASCVAIAPKLFALDETAIAIIIENPDVDESTAILSAQSCPTAAIVITDLESGKQVWPLV